MTNFGASPSEGSSSSSRLRPRHQGAADRQHLLLAAAERRRHLLAPFRQRRKALENCVDVVADL